MTPLLIGGILDGVARIADDLITTDKETRELDLREKELDQKIDLAQIGVNAEEAKSSSVFVSGWRPFIGWVCGAACAWNWLGLPLVSFVLAAVGHPVDFKPADLSEMWPLLLGMLGIGSLRTIEKINRVAR
jgi:hypothetical protein